MNSQNEFLPRSSIASTRASVTGSLGTRKGSFWTTSARSGSPGTSTPSQNDAVPSRTAAPDSVNRWRSAERSASPCTWSGQRASAPRARSSRATPRSAA